MAAKRNVNLILKILTFKGLVEQKNLVFNSLVCKLGLFEARGALRMNWSNNLTKKLRNSYNAMKRLLRGINI
jgi:hypothetical protein